MANEGKFMQIPEPSQQSEVFPSLLFSVEKLMENTGASEEQKLHEMCDLFSHDSLLKIIHSANV